ncbi:unnamed protein product [Paramecium sonneborni]|uniref:Uncharacterized protein n=1 Tax=Paramecium sonneborni TaxID=65129 RepID=A0A8S1RP34_9CILI|nr:unnamed protein product [Paramecium sonneborni]CAD8128454.1 unnamed protein product [Paramecium sonneborni]
MDVYDWDWFLESVQKQMDGKLSNFYSRSFLVLRR